MARYLKGNDGVVSSNILKLTNDENTASFHLDATERIHVDKTIIVPHLDVFSIEAAIVDGLLNRSISDYRKVLAVINTHFELQLTNATVQIIQNPDVEHGDPTNATHIILSISVSIDPDLPLVYPSENSSYLILQGQIIPDDISENIITYYEYIKFSKLKKVTDGYRYEGFNQWVDKTISAAYILSPIENVNSYNRQYELYEGIPEDPGDEENDGGETIPDPGVPDPDPAPDPGPEITDPDPNTPARKTPIVKLRLSTFQTSGIFFPAPGNDDKPTGITVNPQTGEMVITAKKLSFLAEQGIANITAEEITINKHYIQFDMDDEVANDQYNDVYFGLHGKVNKTESSIFGIDQKGAFITKHQTSPNILNDYKELIYFKDNIPTDKGVLVRDANGIYTVQSVASIMSLGTIEELSVVPHITIEMLYGFKTTNEAGEMLKIRFSGTCYSSTMLICNFINAVLDVPDGISILEYNDSSKTLQLETVRADDSNLYNPNITFQTIEGQDIAILGQITVVNGKITKFECRYVNGLRSMTMDVVGAQLNKEFVRRYVYKKYDNNIDTIKYVTTILADDHDVEKGIFTIPNHQLCELTKPEGSLMYLINTMGYKERKFNSARLEASEVVSQHESNLHDWIAPNITYPTHIQIHQNRETLTNNNTYVVLDERLKSHILACINNNKLIYDIVIE